MIRFHELTVLVMIVAWLAGIALAKEGWMTFFAIFVPFYSWYLVIERGLIMLHWIT